MPLDIPTLLVAVAAVTAFCAAARLLLWRMHPKLPGLGQWALAGGMAAVALLIIVAATRGSQQPAGPLMALAQALIAAGFITAWYGFRRFVGYPEVSRRTLALLAAFILVTTAIAGSVTSAALAAAISALVARDLLRGADPGHFARRATGWIYALNALFFVARAIAAAFHQKSTGQWNPDGLAALPALWWLCMMVATTLGMVLMTGERLQSHLNRQANRDPLTGAFNRRAFSQTAAAEVLRARRQQQPLSVLMIDLDHFKRINDHLGHVGGDAILCRFVATAGRALRGEDTISRFGGEEFVALLPNTTGSAALCVAERLRTAFAEEAAALLADQPPLPFAATISIGVAELLPGEEIDPLLRRADAALYAAKAEGRNCCALAEGGEPAARGGMSRAQFAS